MTTLRGGRTRATCAGTKSASGERCPISAASRTCVHKRGNGITHGSTLGDQLNRPDSGAWLKTAETVFRRKLDQRPNQVQRIRFGAGALLTSSTTGVNTNQHWISDFTHLHSPRRGGWREAQVHVSSAPAENRLQQSRQAATTNSTATA